MPTQKPKPTLKRLNEYLSNKQKLVREEIMNDLGYSSPKTYYNKINGESKLSPQEKLVFAQKFGLDVDAIDWKDDTFL